MVHEKARPLTKDQCKKSEAHQEHSQDADVQTSELEIPTSDGKRKCSYLDFDCADGKMLDSPAQGPISAEFALFKASSRSLSSDAIVSGSIPRLVAATY